MSVPISWRSPPSRSGRAARPFGPSFFDFRRDRIRGRVGLPFGSPIALLLQLLPGGLVGVARRVERVEQDRKALAHFGPADNLVCCDAHA
jgi:hypothetical protein